MGLAQWWIIDQVSLVGCCQVSPSHGADLFRLLTVRVATDDTSIARSLQSRPPSCIIYDDDDDASVSDQPGSKVDTNACRI